MLVGWPECCSKDLQHLMLLLAALALVMPLALWSAPDPV
jgi:hypothetical protein